MKGLTSFFQNLTVGKKLLLGLTPITSLLLTMKGALLGLLILILIDLITGIRKNLHHKNISTNPFREGFWKSIKSYLLRQTWRKTYEYGIGIIVMVIFESLIFGLTPMTILGKVFTLSELVVLIPSAVEVYSIFENMESVSGMNILKKIKAFLPEPIKKLFIKDKKNEENN